MLRAITLDYWDTLYQGASEPVRVERRREALFGMVHELGHAIGREEFDRLYLASSEEAMRWWRDEQRGYQTAERIHWLLQQLGIERPDDCAHVAAAVETVDRTLLELPPPFLDGARELLERLSRRYALAIISDTGFASGRAQDLVLRQDGIRGYFTATVYSMDVGHAKPRPEIFHTALGALGVEPHEALHVGDIERTDVAGALAVGMRAVRLDAVRDSGETRAERVARSLGELGDYLLG
ncbi:MAG: HAD family hydrolase [Gemmatimonadaceae bacterium]|nr:HAD family hydrolase [Gemmatimonadaceae bacterium]